MKRQLLMAVLCLAGASSAWAETIEMKVYGLVCGFCANGIEKILRENPATSDVVVSLENKLVALSTKAGTDISDAELTKAITEAGYEVKGINRTQRSMAEIRGEARASAR